MTKTASTFAAHSKPRWQKPDAYRATIENPPKLPRLIILRAPSGYVLGIGYAFKKQGYIAWKTTTPR